MQNAYVKSSQHRTDVLAKERKQAGVLADAVFAQTAHLNVKKPGKASSTAFDKFRNKEATSEERLQAKFHWKNAVGKIRNLHAKHAAEEGWTAVSAPGDSALPPVTTEDEAHKDLVTALENGESEVAMDLIRREGVRLNQRFRASCSYRGSLQNANFPNRTFEECTYLHLAVLGNCGANCVKALLDARCDPTEQVGTAMVTFCPGSMGDSRSLVPKFPRRTYFTAYELAVDMDLSKDVVELLKAAIRQGCRAYDATGTSCRGSKLERSWKETWEWRPERKPRPLVVPDLLEGTACRRPPRTGYNWLGAQDVSTEEPSDEDA